MRFALEFCKIIVFKVNAEMKINDNVRILFKFRS